MSRKRLLRNTLANVGAQGLATVVALVTLPLMLDAYGTAIYGTFLLASSLVGLTAIFDLGIGLTTVREVASHDPNDHGGIRSTVSASVTLFGSLGLVVALALFGAGIFADQLNVPAAQVGLLRDMLWLYAAAQILVWPASAGRHILAGLQRYTDTMWVAVGTTLANAAAIIYVLATGQGPLVLTALYVATSLLAAGATVLLVRRALPDPAIPHGVSLHRPHPDRVKQVIGLGLPVFTIQLSAYLMHQQADRIVVGIAIGAAAIAVYEIAAKFASLVAQMNELATSAVVPYVSALHARDAHDAIQDTFVFGSRYLGLLILPVSALILVWAPDITRVWVGERLGAGTAAAVLAAQMLVFAQVRHTLYTVADSILIGKGRTARWSTLSVGVALLNLALSVALVSRWGIIGVAAATLIAAVVEVPLYLRLIRSEGGLRLRPWFTRAVVPSVGLAAATALLAWAIGSALPPANLWLLAVEGVGVLGIAWGAALTFVATNEERAALDALLSRR